MPVRGVGIRFRFDGGLFDLKRLRAKTSTKFITELQYADDCSLIASSSEDLQIMLDTYKHIYEALGLRLNIDKTKILVSPPESLPTDISLENETLEQVE